MSFETTPWIASALLLLTGVVAGFVNTLAGGGSALPLPLLMLLGLPADVANGTNRISVCAQSVAATLGFDSAGQLDRDAAAAVVMPTLLGSLLGATVASFMPTDLLKPILLGGLMLVGITLVIRPLPVVGDVLAQRPGKAMHLAALFGIGVYGGFLQVGVGFFLLAFLSGVLRYDLIRANALKTLAVAAFTLLALAVFIVRAQVAWSQGLVLAVGTVMGARLGVRFALKAAPKVVRAFVFVAVVGFALAALLKD